MTRARARTLNNPDYNIFEGCALRKICFNLCKLLPLFGLAEDYREEKQKQNELEFCEIEKKIRRVFFCIVVVAAVENFVNFCCLCSSFVCIFSFS